jgi:hypothetical protein
MATWHFITYRQYGYWDFELRSSVPVPTYVESGLWPPYILLPSAS